MLQASNEYINMQSSKSKFYSEQREDHNIIAPAGISPKRRNPKEAL